MPDDGPPQRVSPITVPEEDPTLPAPDASQPALVRDAFREFGFACSMESRWIARSLTLQRQIVRDSTPSRYRNHRYAAALLLWSRIDAVALEVWRLIAWANYAAAPPLIRASLEWLGAEQAVVGSEFAEFEDYLRDFAAHDAEHAASEWGMGQYMAGQQLAMAADLGAVYRAAAELGRPHFGASMLVTAVGVEPAAGAGQLGRSEFPPGLGAAAVGLADGAAGAADALRHRARAVRGRCGAAGVVPDAHAGGGDVAGPPRPLPGRVGDARPSPAPADQWFSAAALGRAAPDPALTRRGRRNPSVLSPAGLARRGAMGDAQHCPATPLPDGGPAGQRAVEGIGVVTTKIGINGFGRIGRQVLKGIMDYHRDDLEVVAVNDLTDTATNAHLFKYDSNYGRYPGEVAVADGALVIDGQRIAVLAERDPGKIPWGDYGVEIVIESTGIFTDATKAAAHMNSGPKKVVISAPAKNEDLTIVLGVNDDQYDPAVHHVVSNASCTTNCLAPIAKVLDDTVGIKSGIMSTIHAYTNDQSILDTVHSDLRRARAAGLNIIPTTTGAAKAVGRVMPHLDGKLNGMAYRVPTGTVSVVDLTIDAARATSAEEINAAFTRVAEDRESPLYGILAVETKPLVSSDFRGHPASSIVDALSTMVLEGTLVKVVSWYDNEWAYSVRVGDLCTRMAARGL